VICELGEKCALPKCDPWCHYEIEVERPARPVSKLIACDGPCETVRAWCPDCDRETEHVRISPTCRECTVCGELSADITSVPCPVDSPA